MTYNAYKLVFKFPQEHKIDEEEHAGELQVFHTAADGGEAIVSFFLDAVSNKEKLSPFFE